MLKLVIGIVIAVVIGAACRYFKLPVPAPPTLYGVFLIFAITIGYLVADYAIPADEKSAVEQQQ